MAAESLSGPCWPGAPSPQRGSSCGPTSAGGTLRPVVRPVRRRPGPRRCPAASRCRVWGYCPDRDAAGAPRPGGPGADGRRQGDTVTITCTTSSPRATSLLVQGQPMVPDRTGAAAGGDEGLHLHRRADRAPTSTRPASLPNAQHQVAMGLYGALVVRPGHRRARPTATPPRRTTTRRCSCSARSTRRSTTRANPADVRHAQVHAALLPGQRQGAPATPTRSPRPWASTVLLRYVNAGIEYHSMGVLGAAPDRRRARRQPADDRHLAAATSPRRSAPARRPTPSSRPRRHETARCPSTTPACCCTTATPRALGGMLTSIDVDGCGRRHRRGRSSDLRCGVGRWHRHRDRQRRRRPAVATSPPPSTRLDSVAGAPVTP